MTDISNLINTARRVEAGIPETERVYARITKVDYTPSEPALTFHVRATVINEGERRRKVTCPLSMRPAQMVRAIMAAF